MTTKPTNAFHGLYAPLNSALMGDSLLNPKIFREFEHICATNKRDCASVLEVGAVPRDDTLLNLPCLVGVNEKFGLNLIDPTTYKDFQILQGNANSMDCFEDCRFDMVLCNAVLEHDKYFWKTTAEINRVTKPSGLIVIGIPAYIRPGRVNRFFRSILKRLPFTQPLTNSTSVFRHHESPGDYYRFSEAAVREVMLAGLLNITTHSVLSPPRIIGYGTKP